MYEIACVSILKKKTNILLLNNRFVILSYFMKIMHGALYKRIKKLFSIIFFFSYHLLLSTAINLYKKLKY